MLLAAVLYLPGSASAQWQQVFGPAGDDVEAIASDALGHIYAGTDTGVYISTDNGTNWILGNSGLLNPEIFSIAATPRGTVLVGTEGSGIFRSTNFGETWDTSSTGLPDSSYILSLASDGHGNLYAGHSMKGVFYSSDDGLHWSARNSNLDSEIIFSLTITPSGVVYAGGNGIVFSSTDSGQHWDTSLIAGRIGVEEVLALAADSSGDVFAGTFLGSRFRLRAGNSFWEEVFSPQIIGPNSAIHALVTDGNSIFAGLFGGGILQSGNLGTTWTDFSGGLTDLKIYSMTAAPSGYLFAGTYQADVFRTSDFLVVGENNSSDEALNVWPQPSHDKVHLSFSLKNSQMTQLEIFDALGREVLAQPAERMQQGQHNLTLDVSTLTSGAYLIVLWTPSMSRSIRCAYLH